MPGRHRTSHRFPLTTAAALLAATAATSPLLAQTTATWLAPASGTWSDPANWSTNPAYPNDSATDALLPATGSPYTVTLNSPVSLHSLTGTSPDVTLNLTTGGALTLSSSLDLGPGSLTLAGGKISGGALKSNLTATAGTLDSLSLASTLTASGYVTLSPTFSLAPTGSIHVTGRFSGVRLGGTIGPDANAATLSGQGELVLDDTSGYGLANVVGAGATTIGPNITVRTGLGSGTVGDNTVTYTNLPVVNQGTISAETPGQFLNLFAKSLTNTGTIQATNHSTLRLWGTFSTSDLASISTTDGGVAYAQAGKIGPLTGTASYTLSAGHATGIGMDAVFQHTTISSADGTPLTVYPFSSVSRPTPTGTATLTACNVLAPVSVNPGATLLSYTGNTFSGAISLTGGTLTLSNTWSAPGPISASANSTLNLNGTPAGPLGPVSLANSTANITTPLSAAQMAGFTSLTNSTLNVTAALTNTGNALPLPAGSTLNLTSAGSLTGGTLGTPGAANGTVLLNSPLSPTLSDLTLAANLTVPNTMAGRLNGTTTLAGSHISIVGNSGNTNVPTRLTVQSLAGTGDVSFDGTGTITSPYYYPTLGIQTLPAGLTVRTGSQSGQVSCAALAGTLSAETPGTRLLLTCYGSITGTLRAANGATLFAPDDTSSLTGPTSARTLAAGTWVATDGGTLDLSDLYGQPVPITTNAASVTLSGPTSRFDSLNALSTNAGSLTLTDGHSLTTQSSLANTGTLTLGPSASLTVTGPLTNTGTIDLAAGSLTLDQTTPDDLRDQLQSGHLLSSLADATHALGYVLQGPALLAHLTLAGDANLDGIITPDDYALLDQGFASGGSYWWQGDFNYDGTVDQNDYLLIDTTLGQAQGFSPGFLAQRESQFGAEYVQQLLTSVPEPLPLSSLLYPLSSLLLTRQRRHPK